MTLLRVNWERMVDASEFAAITRIDRYARDARAFARHDLTCVDIDIHAAFDEVDFACYDIFTSALRRDALRKRRLDGTR